VRALLHWHIQRRNGFDDVAQAEAGGTVSRARREHGIGLAHVCRAKGYKCVIFMPNTQVRLLTQRQLLFALFSRPTQSQKRSTFCACSARRCTRARGRIREPATTTTRPRLCRWAPKRVWADQFDNTANADAHYRTTGPESGSRRRASRRVHLRTGTGGTSRAWPVPEETERGQNAVWLADPPGACSTTMSLARDS